jgi:hypothetical protein
MKLNAFGKIACEQWPRFIHIELDEFQIIPRQIVLSKWQADIFSRECNVGKQWFDVSFHPVKFWRVKSVAN